MDNDDTVLIDRIKVLENELKEEKKKKKPLFQSHNVDADMVYLIVALGSAGAVTLTICVIAIRIAWTLTGG